MSENTADSAALIQGKWRDVWEKSGVFHADGHTDRERAYVLDMFAYPSGDLHMGHAEAFAFGDAVSRYLTQRGYDVLHPVGWDSFGLPAENAAIKRDQHPADWTYSNIDTQAESFRRYGVSFDWSTRLHTSDPEYYRWTQWLFLRFREKGLAYRQASSVNWCPKDQTVLANEQVIQGECERCGTQVTKRDLTQWFFRITAYADRLLDDMELLREGWPERVLAMQRNWIGRSSGAHIDFRVAGRERPVRVFTTRPETLYGATFLVVAADSPLAAELCAPEGRADFDAYLQRTRRLSDIDRLAAGREKTGVPLGVSALHPLTGEPVPVWASDYVLAGYGSGAVMAVPAHDQRDLDFARTFDLPVRAVVAADENPAVTGEAIAADGPYVDSGPLNGLNREAAASRVLAELEAESAGAAGVQYRLRDWLVSRQRFWGCPIPIVHCASCGEVPVPDDQLPVRLPDLRGADLAPAGVSPLAAAEEWVNVPCPSCGDPALRDTDTMDTFVDSSWYFLRYCSPGWTEGPFDPAAVRRWMPVTQYVGGVEHAILHLLYARFFTKVLQDLGLVDFPEPFLSLLNQGQVLLNGSAMSKSKGNMVDLGGQIAEYGVDAVRLTMVFAGPPEDDIDWADVSPAGSARFLARVLRLADDVRSDPGSAPEGGDDALRRVIHRTVAQATQLVETHRFNVVVARTMELANALRKHIDAGGAADPAVREGVEAVAVMLSLFAPYTAEEMWERLGHEPSVSRAGWPEVDPALAAERDAVCVVQVNGKMQGRIEVGADITEDELVRLAQDRAATALGGRQVVRVIAKPPRLVNFVTADPRK
ncbi:leucine--tRNA ligase [Streptomyces sp. SID12501]|uniref:Leucine--tRNA ligase n=1 Tax=Streptomyces sp. SID12501 TaxID=2706042 RepID=A0A6B3BTV3_9ACTN|nr:leucine--tRNA ligase [Streptomyces sp. SID12501]NEC87720.1 leucine--tRNA ligase [Streptomyces sp. SID12501]